MDQEKSQTKEEKAASVLKEVYQDIEDKPIHQSESNDQLSSEQAAKEIRGSDADADYNVGQGTQPDAEDSAEEIKGSDADVDKNV